MCKVEGMVGGFVSEEILLAGSVSAIGCVFGPSEVFGEANVLPLSHSLQCVRLSCVVLLLSRLLRLTGERRVRDGRLVIGDFRVAMGMDGRAGGCACSVFLLFVVSSSGFFKGLLGGEMSGIKSGACLRLMRFLIVCNGL